MNPKEDYSDWKFETTSIIGDYRGTNSDYGMLCDNIISDNKKKEGDKISGNRVITLNVFTTNIEQFWCAKNMQRIRLYRLKQKRKYTRKYSFLM